MMNKFISTYFKSDYLLRVAPETRFEPYFLFIALALIMIVITLKFLFKIKGRSVAYKNFDRLWFWGYFTLSIIGLFLWFSRNQGLPFFGTRLVSYLWIISLFFFVVFLFLYFHKRTKKEIMAHLDRKRKEKYLKK